MAKKNKRGKDKGFSRREMERMVAMNQAMTQAAGRKQGLGALLPAGGREQFLLGLLLGGGIAYVMSDEELRAKIFKSGLQLYTSVMGGLAEMKEQMADLQAEVQAEQNGLI